MTTPTRHRHRRPRHRWITYKRQLGIPLALATAGAAVPYGANDPRSTDLLPWEWVLTAAAAVALVLLIIGLIRRQMPFNIGFLATGVVWVAYAIYELLLSESTLIDSIGMALPAFAWGLLALAGWRALTVRAKRAEAHNGLD